MTEDRLQSADHIPRHPELVSGSISPLSQAVIGVRWMLKQVQHDKDLGRSVFNWRQSKIHRQINPLWVFRFNQVDLPRTMPVLQLLFPRNRIRHIMKHLKSHQSIDSISRRMPGRQVVAMLMQALKQVRCHTDIKRAIGFAREYIDARLFHWLHGQYMAALWTLKQVQGDGWGQDGRY